MRWYVLLHLPSCPSFHFLCLLFFIFVNLSFAAGTSVHACRQLGRHIVALEEDEDTFNRVLKPLKSVKPPVKAPSIVVVATQSSQGTQKSLLALKRSRPQPSQ
jgi:hypothetical protein